MTHINRPARKLLNLDERVAPGAAIEDPHVRERVMNVVRTGESVYDELAEGSDYRYASTLVPIRTGDTVDEVVFVMQEAEYARKIEQKIRRRLANRGLVARKTFDDILGGSPEMREAVRTAKQYAVVNSTVLITGETGTGKEMFAQSIHNYSSRSGEAFVAVNCATIPGTCWNRSFSAMWRALSPERSAAARSGSSSWRIMGRYFWMRSAKPVSICRRGCSAHLRNGRSCGSATTG
jgi:transcriptional regulator with PAS, ATPase and Fis domain